MRRPLLTIAGVALVLMVATRPWPVLGHETLTTTVNFNREIVRILDRRCVMCHSAGRVSFPLETYEETWLQRRPLRLEALSRHMPPWAADPGYGQFVNENRLTLRETQFIVSWVEGRAPRRGGTVFLNVVDTSGPKDVVRARPPIDDWTLGPPSVERPLPEQTIAPGEGDTVRRVVIDAGADRPRRLRALEYRPGDHRVARAVFFSLEQTGQWLGSWTPWRVATDLPAGVAYTLPAGSRIVAELHYRSAREAVVDRGRLGLFFVDAPEARTPSDLTLIASGSGGTTPLIRADTRLAADIDVLSLRPHLRPGIATMEVAARLPDGSTDVLLVLRQPSPAWPTPYILKAPRRLPRGAQITVVAQYERRADLPRGPLPLLTISRY